MHVLKGASLLLLWSTAALAADWSSTFTPAATGTYLDRPQARVLVAAAGPVARQVRAAATALEKALRASGRAPLVLDDQALGPLEGASDPEIVNRARNLPVDLVAVVRVFPGSVGHPDTAVVTFYDKEAKAVSALTAEAGSALAPREGAAAGASVSSGTLKAVSEIGGASSDEQKTDAQNTYDEKYVWFQDAALVAQSGQVIRHVSIAYQGKFRKALAPEEFYRVVGQPALAEQYRDRSQHKSSLLIGGIIAGTAGTPLLLLGVGKSCRYYVQGFCQERNYLPAIAGGAILLAGAAVALWSASIDPNPVDMPTARRLADEYNQGLKKELGLSQAARPTTAVRIALGLSLDPGAPAALLSVTF